MSAYTYRRGSIFWALTLIALGGLFLYQNFNPSIHAWVIIAKFWPVLIIFWGLSKLIDYVQAMAHPDQPSPSLFSGSEVILLLLILALGSLVTHIVLRPWHQWTSALGIDLNEEDWANPLLSSFDYSRTLSQPLGKTPHLVVTVHRGDVELRASTNNQLDAVVKETIRADSEEDARKLADQIKIEAVQEAGHTVLQSNLDSLPRGGSNVQMDWTLHVPANATTEITTERGDILVDGLTGDQSFSGGHGDVRLTNLNGLIRVHKSAGSTVIRDVKGSVELEGRGGDVEISNVTGTVNVNGEFTGSVQFRNVTQSARFTSSRTDMTAQKLTGRLDMEMGSVEVNGIDGPFEITTRQKDISLSGFTHSVKISDNNGDVDLHAGAPPHHPIEVDLRKGQIELGLPPNSAFQIDAMSRHGDVESDFSAPTLKVNAEGDEPSIRGSVGSNGPTIRLSTAYGTIHVAREEGGSAKPKKAGGAEAMRLRQAAPHPPHAPLAPKAPHRPPARGAEGVI